MRAIRYVFLVTVLVSAALPAVAQKKDASKSDTDEKKLETMKNDGYDLSRTYKLHFHLVIALQCEDQVVSRLQEAGFDVFWPTGRVGTVLEARKTMVPELSGLRKIRRDFHSLVRLPCDPGATGSYTGWGFEPDPDKAYLAEAKKAGYDLSKPYKLWFRWTIPPQCEKQAVSRLQQAGFETEGWPKGDVGTILIARKTMVPDLAALQKIRQDKKSLCDLHDPAYYVSWGFVTNHFDGIVMK